MEKLVLKHYDHFAVRFKDCILVLQKSSHPEEESTSRSRMSSYKNVRKQFIRVCNLWTKQWRKYTLHIRKDLPCFTGLTGVTIGNVVYMFGAKIRQEYTVETDQKYKWFIYMYQRAC